MTDTRELAHREPSVGAVQPSESSQLLQMVIAAAKDPSIDAAKMEQMVGLTTSLQDRERLSQFNRDKNAAIMAMPVITKDGLIVIRDKDTGAVKRSQGRYAKWEDIDRVIRPILQRFNLALSFDVAERQTGGVLVTPILTHANGHTERGSAMPVPADISGSKNAAQAIGSATSYGKRYTGGAMLNLITEGLDDDGFGGQVPVASLTFERQEGLLAGARKAHEEGSYQEWFNSQTSAKERAWLVGSGHHAEFGGKALPTPVAPEAVVVEQQRSTPSSSPPPSRSAPSERRRTTPREWTDGFKEALSGYRTEDAMDEFADGQRENLDRLKEKNETLWEECQSAIREQREAIRDGRLM
jgi:hypothetical protein